MNKFKILAITILLIIYVSLITGCASTGDISDIVDKGGKAIATVQVANTAKTIADTQETKAKMNKKYGKDLMAAIILQPVEEKSILLIHSMDAKVEVAKNTWWKGHNIGFINASSFWLLLIIAKYIFDRYKQVAKSRTENF